jgi:HEPN domain-containing protein
MAVTPDASPSADDWARAARDSIRDAKRLAKVRSWRNAYLLAALTLEQALKARIIRHSGVNRWPSRKERPEFYHHDLHELAIHAGIVHVPEQEVAEASELGRLWLIAKDFDINRRCPVGAKFSVRLGRDMVEAASGQNGLVEWLNKP